MLPQNVVHFFNFFLLKFFLFSFKKRLLFLSIYGIIKLNENLGENYEMYFLW